MSQGLQQLDTATDRTVTTSPQTLALTDGVFNSNQAGALTLNLPALATVRGKTFYIRNQNNTAAITLDPNAAETINGAATFDLAVGVTFTKPAIVIYAPLAGTDWWILALTPL